MPLGTGKSGSEEAWVGTFDGFRQGVMAVQAGSNSSVVLVVGVTTGSSNRLSAELSKVLLTGCADADMACETEEARTPPRAV